MFKKLKREGEIPKDMIPLSFLVPKDIVESMEALPAEDKKELNSIFAVHMQSMMSEVARFLDMDKMDYEKL